VTRKGGITVGIPVSAYVKTEGIVFFARMCDKMRLMLKGELGEEYIAKMTVKMGYNSRCLRFLGVTYDGVLEQVKAGKEDEEILAWCFEHGRRPSEEEIEVWNQFMVKKGWRDEESEQLEEYKAQSDLEDRSDIVTFFDYYEVDEGREP